MSRATGSHRVQESRTGRELSRLLLFWATLQAALFLYFFSCAIYPLPRWDHYDWIAGYFGADSLGAWLWQPHNVHRIVPTKLAVLVDIEIFRGLLTPIALASLSMLAGWLAVLARTVNTVDNLEHRSRTAFTGLLLILSLQTYTLDSYTYPANNQFPVSIFLLVCAVCSLLRAAQDSQPGQRGTPWLLAALCAAIACTFSSLNGLFVWPILAYLCWKTRLRAGLPLVLGIAAPVLALHLTGLAGVAGHGSDLPAPARFAGHLVAYFGMPWAAVNSLSTAGLLVGAGVLLLCAHALLARGLRRDPATGLENIGLALILYAVMTALMTSLGRSAQFDMPAHRYTVFAVLAHTGLLCVYWRPLWRRLQATAEHTAGYGLAVALGVVILCQQVAVGLFACERAEAFARLKAQILRGDRSAALIDQVYYDARRYPAHLALMRREGIYLYRRGAHGAASTDSNP